MVSQKYLNPHSFYILWLLHPKVKQNSQCMIHPPELNRQSLICPKPILTSNSCFTTSTEVNSIAKNGQIRWFHSSLLNVFYGNKWPGLYYCGLTQHIELAREFAIFKRISKLEITMPLKAYHLQNIYTMYVTIRQVCLNPLFTIVLTKVYVLI